MGINNIKKIIIAFMLLMVKGNVIEASTLEVAGEYLYFKPILDNTYYAIPYAEYPRLLGTRLSDQYDFSSGYRVEGIYRFFCDQAALRFRWSALNSSHQESTAARYISSVNSNVYNYLIFDGICKDSISLDYDAFDALISWSIYKKNMSSALAVGLHYIKMANNQEDVNYIPPNQATVSNIWSTKTEGIGPELAFFGEYFLPKISCLPRINLLGSVQIGSIVVKNKISNSKFLTLSPILPTLNLANDLANDSLQRIVPFWDLRLGLGSKISCYSFKADLSLGYEILAYYNLINRVITLLPNSAQPTALTTYDFYSDLYLHGLFVRLALSY